MLGYTYDEVLHMIESINIAYEIVDVPADVDKGLTNSISFLVGLLTEGHVQ